MKDARPYLKLSIDRIEALFRERPTDLSLGRKILAELEHRSTERAGSLAKTIRRAIERQEGRVLRRRLIRAVRLTRGSFRRHARCQCRRQHHVLGSFLLHSAHQVPRPRWHQSRGPTVESEALRSLSWPVGLPSKHCRHKRTGRHPILFPMIVAGWHTLTVACLGH